MSTNTKQLIFQTFLDILSKKPFDKITVRDIVDACNVNRNTFYYYYADVYELLDEVFKIETDNLMSEQQWTVAFAKFINTCYQNKKVVMNIYSSKSYEYLESYLFKVGRRYTNSYVQELTKNTDTNEDTLEFLVSFYQYGINGTLTEWFRTGLQDPPRVMIRRFQYATVGLKKAIETAGRKRRIENPVSGQ